MSPDERSRTRTLDPARQARDQVRAGLPVTVCPFCGGPANAGFENDTGVCCCFKCHEANAVAGLRERGRRCTECPHRRPSGEP